MKKTEKIIGTVLIIAGILVIVTFCILGSLVTDVSVFSLSPQTVERIIPCTGTVLAKKSEIVTYDGTVIPDEIKVKVGDRISDGDLLMTAYNSYMRKVEIYSDYDGIVTSLAASVGKEAKYGTTLAVISQTDKMEVNTQVSEADIAAVSVGQSVKITGDGFGGKEYSGTVSRISSLAEQTSANGVVIGVTVDIDNTDETILPGMSAKVYITANKSENVLAVPYSAIEYDGDDAYVYIANGNDIQRVKVEIGIEGYNAAEITGGVKIGDTVVENKNELKNSFKVRVKKDD